MAQMATQILWVTLVWLSCASLTDVMAGPDNYAEYSDMKIPMYAEYESHRGGGSDDDYKEHIDVATVDYKDEEYNAAATDIPADAEKRESPHYIKRSKKSTRPSQDIEDVRLDKNVDRDILDLKEQDKSESYFVQRRRHRPKQLQGKERQSPQTHVKNSRREERDSINLDKVDKSDDMYSNIDSYIDDRSGNEDKVELNNDEQVIESGIHKIKGIIEGDNLRKVKTKQRKNHRTFEDSYEENNLASNKKERQRGRRNRDDSEYVPETERESNRPKELSPYGDSNITPEEVDDDITSSQNFQTMPSRPQGENYQDYYDMKKVKTIKKKLPQLLKRTSVRPQAEKWTAQSIEAPWEKRRRPFILAQNREDTDLSTTDESAVDSKKNSVTNIISTTTNKTKTSIPIESTLAQSAEELSIAEKSRLSILKKAERKENDMTVTKKPPVLLQVTQKPNTMVMIEPPTQKPVRSRVRIVSGDTPERLSKVKKLMRQKLIANANNVDELTDNWDEMVCDYVDTALLDSQSGLNEGYRHTPPTTLPVLLIVTVLYRI